MLLEKHDRELMKKNNRMLVFDMILKCRPISRAEIAKKTGMSAASAGRIVADLIEFGLVKETEQLSSGVGRKATMLDIDVDAFIAVGIHVDRNVVKVGLVNLDGQIIAEEKRYMRKEESGPSAVAEYAAELVRRLLARHPLGSSKLIGVGVGLPGIMNTAEGTVVFSAQLEWRNARFAKELEARLHLPVVLDNDLKVKALAESAARSIGTEGTTALVSIGSGVGSALIIGQQIYRGANNFAGEIGHSTVDPNGRLCECGKRGCLQTYITDLAMLQEANQVKPVSDMNELLERMRSGEHWAKNIIERACTYAAVTINNVVCVYNPDTIILTGEFIEDHAGIFEMIQQKLAELVWGPFGGTFQVVRSQLRDKSVMIGAARLVLQQRFDQGLDISI